MYEVQFETDRLTFDELKKMRLLQKKLFWVKIITAFLVVVEIALSTWIFLLDAQNYEKDGPGLVMQLKRNRIR